MHAWRMEARKRVVHHEAKIMINKALDFSHARQNFEGNKESIRSDRRKRMQYCTLDTTSFLWKQNKWHESSTMISGLLWGLKANHQCTFKRWQLCECISVANLNYLKIGFCKMCVFATLKVVNKIHLVLPCHFPLKPFCTLRKYSCMTQSPFPFSGCHPKSAISYIYFWNI